MYHDSRNTFWWRNMKGSIASFEERCLTCQQIKAEYQRPSGLLQPLEVPEWKWEHVTMDFVTGLPRSNRGNEAIGGWERHLPLIEFAYNNSYQSTIGMAPYEALYGRKCRSPIHWDEVGEKKVLGLDIVKRTVEAIEKVRERIKVAQDRHKSYADPKRKELQFVILERVGRVAYRLALPPAMSGIHNVFHVSMLRRYMPDPSHVVSYETIELDRQLSYEEKPKQARS
ncbi:hypothetical protein DH2020_042401 [Rehmannia glutinosa]|uniref:Tf2-1-like SH3-like domain-containing protein n=1 Tax=Rehmannia glutinosa TaxID=99300 RepID=A0ABR0UNI7_REHGL